MNKKYDLLFLEKSNFEITPVQDENNKYVLEGVFTEFGRENRNGRVYTKKEFMPHFNELKKVVESGKCVGELDHPKVFETCLKNVSHKITDIWMDDVNERVMGRIELVDTDAGRNAKALIDAGVPLHISSRAAGTVSENKEVRIQKLFTYDLVDTPGFANAVLKGINESYGFDQDGDESNFTIFKPENSVNEDSSELNNKKTEKEVDFITEKNFNEYSDFTKKSFKTITEELSELKKVHESIIEQNDNIVDEFNNAKVQETFEAISSEIEQIKKWADHATETVTKLEESGDSAKYAELLNKMKAFESWSNEVTETVTALEDWSDHATGTVTKLEETTSAVVAWSDEATETVTRLEESDKAIQSWSDEATETVTKLEETTNAIVAWSNEATETVTKLEESTQVNNKEVVNESIEDFRTNIFNKIEAIVETKKQGVENDKSINESVQTENVNESVNNTLWLSNIPSKFQENWNSLSEAEQLKVEQQANQREFKNVKSIREFWNNTFSKENVIKSEKIDETKKQVNANGLTEREQMYVNQYKGTFGKN